MAPTVRLLVFLAALVGATRALAADAPEFADTIEAVGGSIGSDAGNNSFSVSLDLTQPDFKLGAELLSDVLLQIVNYLCSGTSAFVRTVGSHGIE